MVTCLFLVFRHYFMCQTSLRDASRCSEKDAIMSEYLGTVRRSILSVTLPFNCCPMSIKNELLLKHLTPNGHYMGRTAQLTSRCCILYIYSTNIRTEYFKHAA